MMKELKVQQADILICKETYREIKMQGESNNKIFELCMWNMCFEEYSTMSQ